MVSAINEIIKYLCATIEGLTPLSYPSVAYKRWTLPISFNDSELDINHRAFRLLIEDGGNSTKLRQMSGTSRMSMRENLVLSMLYAFDMTELVGQDNQGIDTIWMEDMSQLRATFLSPTLFGALSGYTVYRPVYVGNRQFRTRNDYLVNELIFDLAWMQSLS